MSILNFLFAPVLDRINQLETRVMSVLSDLQDKVAAAVTVEESAITLLQGLKKALDDALASNDTAALQALSDQIGAETQKLADAITANTPAAPSA